MPPLIESPANATLLQHVHPDGWTNPDGGDRYNLVVIGAGTAGLVTAAGAAGLGARVALVERHLMGGDCLNVGCVPSKGVISAARAAAAVRGAAEFGVQATLDRIDFAAAMERMRTLRAAIAPNDSATRFRDLGVDVFFGEAAFTADGRVQVTGPAGDRTLEGARSVIATGARAFLPDVPGLKAAQPLTNETVFSLTEPPRRLAVLGGGPIGSELAQSMARLGVEVVLIERSAGILGGDDPAAAAIVQNQMRQDGVTVLTQTQLDRVESDGGGHTRQHTLQHTLHLTGPDGPSTQTVSHILVGAGRQPNVETLNLDAVGVAWTTRHGVEVDDTLRTANKRIYACGDVCSRYKFTHAADFMARIVINNALFASRLPTRNQKLSDLVIPHATYTSPEVAAVGQTATAEGEPDGDCYTVRLDDVDRAILEGETEGFVKIWTERGGDRILGATIVAEAAGEMIGELTMAMTHGIGLGDIAGVIHPYPTQAEAIRKCGDQYRRTKLTPLVAGAFDKLLAWTR